MRIAIAHWQGRVSPVFDVSDRLVLIDTAGIREVHRQKTVLACRDPFRRARELLDLKVRVLICGAVSHSLETALIGSGIQVFSFLCGSLEEVLNGYLKGRLADARFRMPGFCGNRRKPAILLRRSNSANSQRT